MTCRSDPQLLAEGWKYLGTRREKRTDEDITQALREQGSLPEGQVIQMHFTFAQYMRVVDHRLQLLAVQVEDA